MKNTTLTFLDRGWNAEFAERADVLVELLRTNYTLVHLKWEGFWPLNEEGTKLVYEMQWEYLDLSWFLCEHEALVFSERSSSNMGASECSVISCFEKVQKYDFE